MKERSQENREYVFFVLNLICRSKFCLKRHYMCPKFADFKHPRFAPITNLSQFHFLWPFARHFKQYMFHDEKSLITNSFPYISPCWVEWSTSKCDRNSIEPKQPATKSSLFSLDPHEHFSEKTRWIQNNSHGAYGRSGTLGPSGVLVI